VPYYRQLLPIFNMFKNNNRKSWDWNILNIRKKKIASDPFYAGYIKKVYYYS
jgi:hypothetical protein